MASVAGGRAKRRRLARALLERPAVLADGRSPAPRVVGDLLIALRSAGAAGVAPPACAGCGRPLRTMQRRGQDWYCRICGPNREPCAACGNTGTVTPRDRDGQPRCGQCPPGDGQDPIDIVVRTRHRDRPALAARGGGRRGERGGDPGRAAPPSGLGAAGPARAPHRGGGPGAGPVGAAADRPALRRRALPASSGPPCPHCGRVIALARPSDGQRLCRNCVARSRAVPCSRCGAVRETATRDAHGKPLCPYCLITDPANQGTAPAAGAAARSASALRTGHYARPAAPVRTLTCSICGRTRARARYPRSPASPGARHASSDGPAAPAAGTPARSGAEPPASRCARPALAPTPTSGATARAAGRPAGSTRAAAPAARSSERLRDLLGDAGGEIRPELQALYQALAGTERPDTAVSWLGKSAGATALRDLGAGQRPSPTTYSTGCPPASRSSICAASWSPSGHYRRAMSR